MAEVKRHWCSYGCPAMESPNPINWLKPKKPEPKEEKILPVDEKKPIQ